MDGLLPGESRATLALWMGPQEANVAGFVHGGIVMKLCDEAASLAAVKHSRQRVVTAAIDRLVYFAGWTDKYPQIFGSVNPVATPHFNFTTPEPTGAGR